MASRMSARRDLSPIPLPPAAAPVAPFLRSRGRIEVAENDAGDRRTVLLAAPDGPAEVEVVFPHDDAGVYLLDSVSLPARWTPERGLEFEGACLVLASPDLASAAAVETPRAVRLRLARGQFALAATLAPGERLQLAVRTGGDLLPAAGGALADDDPPQVAARLFCRYFAVLDKVSAGRFGAPLQDRRRILEHLRTRREELEALGRPEALEPLAPGDTRAGYVATWPGRAFIMLAGRASLLRVPAGTTRVDVLGEGTLELTLSDAASFFTAYAHDRYGRPAAAWGGRRDTLRPLALAPAESVFLATSPECR